MDRYRKYGFKWVRKRNVTKGSVYFYVVNTILSFDFPDQGSWWNKGALANTSSQVQAKGQQGAGRKEQNAERKSRTVAALQRSGTFLKSL